MQCFSVHNETEGDGPVSSVEDGRATAPRRPAGRLEEHQERCRYGEEDRNRKEGTEDRRWQERVRDNLHRVPLQ